VVRTLALFPLFSLAAANAATLEPETSKAWDEYIRATTVRMEQRLTPGAAFLWVDESPDRLARAKAGEILVSPVGPQNPKKVPSGLIHDWIGAAFIPDVRLPEVLGAVRDYGQYKDWYQPSVMDSKVIAAGQDRDRYSMLLRNKSLLLKTAFTADYEVRYVQPDSRRAYSIARSTRMQEIDEYGLPEQHLLPEGEGHGIIWSLFSITRFLERDGGVYVEFEAVGLSRDIPGALRLFIEPMVRRVSRNSLETSLEQTQRAVRTRAEVARSGAALSNKP
jgi:hypothetical protein